MKDRRPLTKSNCDLFSLVTKLLLHKAFCCCRNNKFGNILKQGRGTINRELDIFHFLKNQRNQEATLNSLTTYEQRRLIKQQVRAGLLVAPVKGGVTKKNRRDAGKLWDSGDEETSSGEDFNFLKQKIQTAKDGELDDETMKLMRGVIH